MGRPIKKTIINHVLIHPYGESNPKLITKQKGSRRYECADNGDTVFTLIDSDGLSEGKAYMVATDANGNTYYVVKLTAHKATLVRNVNNEAEWLYQNNQAAPWSFASATGAIVQVENA